MSEVSFSSPNRRLAHYTILNKLGTGGMGDVFLARDEDTGEEVALKIPHANYVEDAEFRRRFLREGEIGKQLSHEGIIAIREAGETDGHLYLAMEYVESESLKAILAQRREPSRPMRPFVSPARSRPSSSTPTGWE